ncbi:leucine-rich repeat domain-containing protein [Clostridium neuense]|uniref:Leucine-rich repeat domain-containing protein n=1 Tax=Clostridium neuense TaxID=1728934 RepID=A0ABW8TJG9_9CLOT
MKKIIIIASTIIILMLSTFKVKAATFKDNQIVQANKIWTICFNQEVSLDDLSKQGITVVDSSGTKVNITLSIESDGKTIEVNPPDEGYSEGSTYKLIIGSKVHSKQNKNIKQEIAMNFSIKKSNEDDVVTFKDINLEKAVRNTIGKPNGTIYKKDVDKMTYLYVNGDNIVSLDGIEEFTSLEDIGLKKNQITNIAPLQNLHNLKEIDIGDNPIKDVSALAKLSNLRLLDIENEPVDVECLKQIKDLKISSYYMSDFNQYCAVYNKCKEILKSIIKPEMSDLQKEKAIHDYIVLNAKYDYYNYVKNTVPQDDYSPYGILINGTGVCNGYAYTTQLLLNMAGVNCIVVVGTVNGESHAWNIVQIGGKNYQLDTTWDDSDIEEDVSYEYFNISDSEMAKDHEWSIHYYPKCTSSLNEYGVSGDTVLKFKDCNLEQAIKQLLNRTDGNILVSDIRDIDNIEYSPTDESKKIKDLSGIENFENLVQLQLDGNCIENIEPLKDVQNLRMLTLNNNKISDVSMLSNLKKLNSLSLANNNISNIDALGGITNLKSLDLSNNNIQNVDALKNLTNLTFLYLKGNPIKQSDIDALKKVLNNCKISY